jgi:hypothetical protein
MNARVDRSRGLPPANVSGVARAAGGFGTGPEGTATGAALLGIMDAYRSGTGSAMSPEGGDRSPDPIYE